MNKNEFINAVAAKSELEKSDAEKAVNAFLLSIKDALAADDKITFLGFGTFEIKERPAKMGRNPVTGEPMQIPAARVPVFKASKALKDAVSK